MWDAASLPGSVPALVPGPAARHVPARLKRTSKKTQGPWRIESWGQELHFYPHKDELRVSAPLKQTRGTVAKRREAPRANQVAIDWNASAVRNDFLQHNRWRVEK